MSAERISERYARSLFEIAKEQQVLSEVHTDMAMIESLCRDSVPLRRFLQSPIIGEQKKVAVLRAIFAKSVHSISMQLIELLTKKGRAAYLGPLSSSFVARYRAYKGHIHAELLVAHALDDKLQQQFIRYIEKLTQKEPLLKTKVQPSLVGGFVLRLGTQQVDKSVATQLRDLKKTLMQPPSAISNP